MGPIANRRARAPIIARTGKHQGRVLALLYLVHTRPVPADILAWVADPDVRQSNGVRVLASLYDNGLIRHEAPSTDEEADGHPQWRLTPGGLSEARAWLIKFLAGEAG